MVRIMSSLPYRRGPVTVLSVPSRNVKKNWLVCPLFVAGFLCSKRRSPILVAWPTMTLGSRKEEKNPFWKNNVGRGVEVEENGGSSQNFAGRKFISIRSAGPNHT